MSRRFQNVENDFENRVKEKFIGMWRVYIEQNRNEKFEHFNEKEAESQIRKLYEKIMPELKEKIRSDLPKIDKEDFEKYYRKLLERLFISAKDQELPVITTGDQRIFNLGLHFRLYHLAMLLSIDSNELKIHRNLLETIMDITMDNIAAINFLNTTTLLRIHRDDPKSIKNIYSSWKDLIIPFSVNFNYISKKYAKEMILTPENLDASKYIKDTYENISLLDLLNEKLILVYNQKYNIIGKAYEFYKLIGFNRYMKNYREMKHSLQMDTAKVNKFLDILYNIQKNLEKHEALLSEFKLISNRSMSLLYYTTILEVDQSSGLSKKSKSTIKA